MEKLAAATWKQLPVLRGMPNSARHLLPIDKIPVG